MTSHTESKNGLLSNIRSYWNQSSSIKRIGLLGLSFIFGLTANKLYDICKRKYYNLPPGPTYRSLWLFNKYWYIQSMTNSYGPCFMMYLGGINCIFITDAKLIRKTLTRSEFCHHRPMHDAKGYYPLYDLKYNQSYINRRNIIHESFNLKMTNNHIHSISNDIYKSTIYKQLSETSTILNFDQLGMVLKEPIFYMIFGSIFGKFLEVKESVNEQDYLSFMESLNAVFDDLEYSFLLKLILGDGYIGKKIRALTIARKTNSQAAVAMDMIDEWYKVALSQNNLAKHQANNKGKQYQYECDCMLGILLNAQSSLKSPISTHDVKSDLLVVFFGVHTTGRSVVEAIILLAIYSEYQDKIYQEINDIGYKSHRDNHKLHLLRAVIHDSLRLCTNGFFTGVVRTIEKDGVRLGKHNINKNSIVLPCYPLAMHDPKYWDEPHSFNPNHFLNQKTNKYQSHIAFNKFGVGKRYIYVYNHIVVPLHNLL